MQILDAAIKGLMACGITLLFAGETRAQMPVEEDSGTITMTGTVEEIEIPERVMMVITPSGRTIVGVISPGVKDIKTIKKREKVTIKYTQEVAVALRKADGVPKAVQNKFEESETADMGMNAPTVAVQNWMNMTPKGKVDDLTTIEITATIAAVNRNQRTMTFAGWRGRTRTIYVPATVLGFDGLEAGDMVVIEITRASIIALPA